MEKMLIEMTTKERGNMTIDQFTAEYGYTLEDILQLGWLVQDVAFNTPIWFCAEGNNSPASIFFFDPVWLTMPEIRRAYAPMLAEIIRQSKEHINFHCFAFGEDIYYVWKDGAPTDEELEYKRVRVRL